MSPGLEHCTHTSHLICIPSPHVTGPEVPLSREEEVDLTLLKNDSGVESALLYAKAWSKYIKDLLGWMEKRVTMGEIFMACTFILITSTFLR